MESTIDVEEPVGKQWKKWEHQNSIGKHIKSLLNDKLTKAQLLDKAVKVDPEFPGALWFINDGNAVDNNIQNLTEVVSNAIDELLSDWLIFQDESGVLHVSEDEKDALIEATGQMDYPNALMFLFNKNIYHPDMERLGLTDDGADSTNNVTKDKQNTGSNLAAMPDSKSVIKVQKAQGLDLTYQEVPEGAEKIQSVISHASKTAFKTETHDFSIDQIKTIAALLSSSDMAIELGSWIINSVEQFIDNHETIFRLYLNVSSEVGMPVSSLFQKLYLSVPDVDVEHNITEDMIDSTYDLLDSKLWDAQSIMNADDNFRTLLFKKMSYFYELTGFVVKDGQVQQAITKEMHGDIKINELVFDPITLTTTVAQGVGINEGGKIKEGDDKVVVKQEDMPAGFGIELEISFNSKNTVPLTMY